MRDMSHLIISADSHVTEPPNTYVVAFRSVSMMNWLLCDNVAELYRIDLAALV
jgi:hypothetical protein